MDPWVLTQKLVVEDDSTDLYEKQEFRPDTTISPTSKDIKIQVLDKTNYFLYSEAQVEVQFVIKNGADFASATALTEAQRVYLPSGLLLWEDASLQVNNTLIGTLKDPGMTHHLKSLPEYSQDYQTSVASNQFYYPMKARDASGLGPSGTRAGDANVSPQFGSNATSIDISDGTFVNVVSETRQMPFADHLVPIRRPFVLSNVNGTGAYGATSMDLSPEYDENFSKSVKAMTGSKVVRYLIPLKELFPALSQAMSVVTRGSTLTLDLKRIGFAASDYATAFYSRPIRVGGATTATPTINVGLVKVSLWVPRLRPSLAVSDDLAQLYASQASVIRKFQNHNLLALKSQPTTATSGQWRIATNAARPTKIIVAFQHSNKRTDLARQSLQFDTCNVDQLELRVNQVMYPAERYQVGSDASQHIVRALDDVYRSTGKVGMEDAGSLIDFESYSNGPHRIYVFDLSHSAASEFEKKNLADLDLRWRLSADAPTAFDILALIVEEKELKQELLNSEVIVTLN